MKIGTRQQALGNSKNFGLRKKADEKNIFLSPFFLSKEKSCRQQGQASAQFQMALRVFETDNGCSLM